MTTDPNAKASTLAEGSAVGACGEQAPSLIGMTSVVLCYLAAGHTGMHTDGVTQWTPGLIYPTASAVYEAKIAALEAKLEVVEKQRDNAQQRLQRLDEGLRELGYESAQDVVSDALGALFAAMDGRDEARGRLDALVAEVRKIADYVHRYLDGSAVLDEIHTQLLIALEAIAKMAPQTAPPADGIDELLTTIAEALGIAPKLAALVDQESIVDEAHRVRREREAARAAADKAYIELPEPPVLAPWMHVRMADDKRDWKITSWEQRYSSTNPESVYRFLRAVPVIVGPAEPRSDDKPAAIALSREELIARRDRLLAEAGMCYEELRARAVAYDLRPNEREIYEGIESIDYLLGDDKPAADGAATEERPVPLRKRSAHVGGMTPLMWDIAEIVEAWTTEEQRQHYQRPVEDLAHQIVLDCDLERLEAERDAAVKARDEAQANRRALVERVRAVLGGRSDVAPGEDLIDAALRLLSAAEQAADQAQAELADILAVPPAELQTYEEQRLRRDLAESANTIAALHKAADEHTKEIKRLQKQVASWTEQYNTAERSRTGWAAEASRTAGDLAVIRRAGEALAQRMHDADPLNRRADRVWARELRALLASPTSSATEATDVS